MEEIISGLYSEHFKNVFLFVNEKVRNKETSKDIAQDVFFKFCSAIKKGLYNDTGNRSGFIFTIAHNEVVNYLESRYYQRVATTFELDPWFEFRDENNVHNDYCSKETLSNVIRIIGTLPEFYVQAFNLRYFENLKFKDIAAIQGIPIGTVKSRLNFCDLHLKKSGFIFFKNKKINKKKKRMEMYRKKKLLKDIA